MYSNKVVACIKVNGKILRENKDVVNLPFGTEYSILIKNLNSVKVKVKVDIDGQDATGWVIVPAYKEIELERFIKDNNWSEGNRFKFIERTEQIEEHRGIKSDDGLIRIEYAFEKQVKSEDIHHYNHYYHNNCWGWPYWNRRYRNDWTLNCRRSGDVQIYSGGGWSAGLNTAGQFQNAQTFTVTSSNSVPFTASQISAQNMQISKCSSMDSAFHETEVERGLNSNDIGITVPGSISNQKFVSGYIGDTHPSEVIIIHLKGYQKSQKITKPVFVEDKKYCSTCGKKNKATHQYCASCGTALVIV